MSTDSISSMSYNYYFNNRGIFTPNKCIYIVKPINNYGSELVTLCRIGKEEQVVKIILADKSLSDYIKGLCKHDKVIYQSIIHDTILSFIRTAMKPDFKLRSQPMGYLKTIARNYWYAELRKNKVAIDPITEDNFILSESYLIDFDRKSLLTDLLSQISQDCKEILVLWSKKYKIKEITDRIGANSVDYIKKKKHICLKKLIAIVEHNPQLKGELKGYV